jgi:hypothetical protein
MVDAGLWGQFMIFLHFTCLIHVKWLKHAGRAYRLNAWGKRSLRRAVYLKSNSLIINLKYYLNDIF